MPAGRRASPHSSSRAIPCVICSMQHGAKITDLSPEVFALIGDQLLPISKDGSRTDALDFACLRLSSRGVRALCDAAVRRLDLRHRSSDEMQALLHRFTGTVLTGVERRVKQS